MLFAKASEDLSSLPPDYLPPLGLRRGAAPNPPQDLRDRVIAGAEAALGAAWPQLLAGDYRDYLRRGDRAGYEARCFTRRHRLNTLTLAALLDEDPRYLDAVVDGLWLACEESGWQLPAHNAYSRGGARLALPDDSAPVVDLFAAETGAQLALIAALLGPRLAEISPEILARIDRELERRLIRPVLEGSFWWMGLEGGELNNWTPWCAQNLLLTAFVRPVFRPVRRALVRRLAVGLDGFLAGYGEDGACEEGPQYYRHAALCLWGCLEILSSVAPEAFAPLWRDEKIGEMADYIRKVHIAGQSYFNFADSAARIEHCGVREYLFGEAVGKEALARFAALDAMADPEPEAPRNYSLWHRLLTLAHAEELRAEVLKPPPPPPEDGWFPSIGLMVARDEAWALAVKAGDNGDSHNHNDVGSFTLYREGRPVFIDVGVETYTAKTFSPERYDIWTMQSSWHNLPDFGGFQQRDGAEYAARSVGVDFTPAEARIDMELAGAWGPEARLRSYRRRVRLIRGSGVEVWDEFDGDLPARLSLILAVRPEMREGGFELPGLAQVEIEGARLLDLEEVPVTDARLRQSWPAAIWRIRVAAEAGGLRLFCAGCDEKAPS